MDDDAMDVDSAVAATAVPAPAERSRLRIALPERMAAQLSSALSGSPVPFPRATGPPSPTKQSSLESPFKRPALPARLSGSSPWLGDEQPPFGRSSSPTKSSASGSWSSMSRTSSRSSSPTKSSRSSARPPSPTSLPWNEGKLPQSPSVSSLPDGSIGRRRPPSLRLHDNPTGLDPTHIIGKTLRQVRRGSSHLTLFFSDDTSAHIKIEGYHPGSGLSKELELDPSFDSVLNPTGATQLNNLILDCALIRLQDKAFERHDTDASRDSKWNQPHLGLAFKLDGLPNRWYTVWATMTDRDDDGECKLLSYDDVFLSSVAPRRSKHARKKSFQQG